MQDKALWIIQRFFTEYMRKPADFKGIGYDKLTNKIVVSSQYAMAFNNWYPARPSYSGNGYMFFNVIENF